MASYDFSQFFDDEKAFDRIIHILPKTRCQLKRKHLRRSKRVQKLQKLDNGKIDRVSEEPEGLDEFSGRKFHIASYILAGHSKYFNSLFYSEFKESTQKTVVIELLPSKVDFLYEAIRAVYTQKLPENQTAEQLLEFISISDCYDLPFVYTAAMTALQEADIDLANCLVILDLPEAITSNKSFQPLKEKVVDKIVSCFNGFENIYNLDPPSDVLDLTTTAWKEILQSDQAKITSENDIWTLLEVWEEHNSDVDLYDLVPYIRFSQMTPTFLSTARDKNSEIMEDAIHNALVYTSISKDPTVQGNFVGDAFAPRASYTKSITRRVVLDEKDVRDAYASDTKTRVYSNTIYIFGAEVSVIVKSHVTRGPDSVMFYLIVRYPAADKFNVTWQHKVEIIDGDYKGMLLGESTNIFEKKLGWGREINLSVLRFSEQQLKLDVTLAFPE